MKYKNKKWRLEVRQKDFDKMDAKDKQGRKRPGSFNK